uniref:Uncharacterized protein n=1 Tax=Timema douglasi TaxID=61478 RepID=A0A7R8VA94_TIMDO|nr:unnamed protein product [Timema douglasi]
MVTIMNQSGGDTLAIAVRSNNTIMNHMVSDDEDGCPSSPGSAQFNDSGDLMAAAMNDEVTAQLAAADELAVGHQPKHCKELHYEDVYSSSEDDEGNENNVSVNRLPLSVEKFAIPNCVFGDSGLHHSKCGLLVTFVARHRSGWALSEWRVYPIP